MIGVFVKAVPLILANLSPVLSAKLFPKMNAPVDFNKKWKGKRVFGSHKTWRGVATMMCVGLLSGYLVLGSIKYGLLTGVGVVAGDLLTSFIKRKINLKPGASFEPWDSEILVACVIIATWDLFNAFEVLGIMLAAPFIYKAFNVLGFMLKLQKNPW